MHWFCNFLRGKGIELHVHSGLQVLLMINENIFRGVKTKRPTKVFLKSTLSTMSSTQLKKYFVKYFQS